MKTNGLVILKESETAYAAARAMKDHNVGCVLVVGSDGKLTGLVTDRDIIMRCVCDDRDSRDIELRFIMSKSPVVVSETDDTQRIVHFMRSLGVRRIPVVTSQGKPVRLVTLDDLIVSGKADLAKAREVVVHQVNQPARLRPLSAPKRIEENELATIARSSGAYSVSPEDLRLMAEDENGMVFKSPASQSRAQQTLGNFLHVAKDCLEARNVFGLEKHCVAKGMETLLKTLVRAMNPGAASNFIAQMPSIYHEALLSEPAGPDHQISRAFAERAIRMSMAIKPDQATEALAAFCETIALSVSSGEAQHLTRVLPGELSKLIQEAVKTRAA